jgi:nuclear pore complex protein Nup160
MVEDVLSFSNRDYHNLQQGSRGHLLRKLVLENEKQFALTVFLCFSQHSQFCVVRPVVVDGQVQLEQLATVYAPDYDLVDFQVNSNHLWALWTNADNDPVLRYATFASTSGDSNNPGWSNVVLEDALNPDFGAGQTLPDPGQAYLQQIFQPGRFSIQTLVKTVSVSCQ